jgi:hypothetical protein
MYGAQVRTTVTLDDDVEALVRKVMRERGVSFKHALNDAVRAGLRGRSPRSRVSWTTPSAMGRPSVSLERALQLASELEDEELLRKMRQGK